MRKIKILFKNILPFMIAFFGLASCLEDTGYLDIYNGENSQPVVSFGQADHGFVVRTVEVNTAPQDITVNVNVARATSDVTVTVEVDPAALTAYNQAQLAADPTFTPYELLPDSTYTIPSGSVTIPKGTLDEEFVFQVVSSKISLDYAYMLPLKITTSTQGTVIATNLNTALVSVGVKNIYDGVYEVVGGSITRNSATGPDLVLGGNYNAGIEIELSTLTANSVAFQPTWKEGSAIGGIDNTYMIIDPATNNVTVLSAGNPTLKNTPASVNTYDPATKTFTLNFDWGNAPSTRVIQNLQLKYVGPRP